MSANLSPEERARVLIDEQLTQAGWTVQDRKEIDLVNYVGVAVREAILKNVAGRADYLLYVNRKIVGVIEAKPSGVTLTEVQWQSHRYSKGLDADQAGIAVLHREELPFIYEASGTETHFTNLYDPEPRARHIFNFQKPETLARFIRESEIQAHATWRGCVQNLPDTESYDLRPASRRAVIAIEQSLKNNQHSNHWN